MKYGGLVLFMVLCLCSIAFGAVPIARYDFENNLNDAMGVYNLTATGTITYDNADMQVGSYSGV